ncbi:hypothetical protein [Stieleria neptunia]|uniref:hypothetical protein n=1 Tax=Stieleria neptunia TaxID=2527979 RepID=UPI0018D25220|nr:hypothetical protein [Stieleria neptunia]
MALRFEQSLLEARHAVGQLGDGAIERFASLWEAVTVASCLSPSAVGPNPPR